MVDRQPTTTGGGLHLPKHIGVSQKETEAATLNWDTLAIVEKNLTKLGFELPEKPTFPRPKITVEQLTTVVNKDYTTLYAQELAWFNYTSPIFARVRAKLLQIRNEKRDIEVRIRKALRQRNRELPKDERFNERDIEDETWCDARYKVLVKDGQQFEQTEALLKSYLETSENTLKVISRQVEIRKTELDGSRTESYLPNRGRLVPRTP